MSPGYCNHFALMPMSRFCEKQHSRAILICSGTAAAELLCCNASVAKKKKMIQGKDAKSSEKKVVLYKYHWRPCGYFMYNTIYS